MISIVDDDASVREATASLMRSAGYSPLVFASARAFLESAEVDGTRFLIADMQMPGMSGLELHSALSRAGKRIPTVIITAYPDEQLRKRALDAGVVRYMAKPFSETELIDCIQETLHSAEQ
jgi:FixJ family two-component response regulator